METDTFIIVFLFVSLITARPTSKSTQQPNGSDVDWTDAEIELPEVEVPKSRAKPMDKVLSDHGFTYLMKFGYLPTSLLETGELRSAADARDAVRTFQQFARLPLTGRLDAITLAMMERPRCGVSDLSTQLTPQHPDGSGIQHYSRRRRDVTKGWNKLSLTYRIINYTPDMTFDLVRSQLDSAFRLWTHNSPLKITEVLHGEADVEVQFAKKYHSDGYPFDGPGLVLAHAFYPAQDLGGDIHFDDDELWTAAMTGSDTKSVNLFSVAAHEFGHSLGLRHSPNPASLMYPWYQDLRVNYTLPDVDLADVISMYGINRSVPTVDTVTSSVPVLPPVPRPGHDDKPDTCHNEFDAIAMIQNELFIFKDKWFWRVNKDGRLQEEPISISLFWYGLDVPSVDAVYQSPKYGHIVFFHGTKYWLFESNYLQRDFPREGRPITEMGIPHDVTSIDAAFIWGHNKRLYLISGDIYWRVNEEGRTVDHDYPRDMGIWQGVPTPVSAAFTDWDDVTYFVVGTVYFTFEDTYMRVKPGGPLSTSQPWLGCPAVEKRALEGSGTWRSLSSLILVLSLALIPTLMPTLTSL